MSKDESKGEISYGFLLWVFLALGSFIYVFFIVPTYPKIDSSLPKEIIEQKIESAVTKNINEVGLEYSNDKRKLAKFKKAVMLFGMNMDKCKTKECLVSEYEDFMDDWVSSRTKSITRYYYISDLGIIGYALNEVYKEFY